VSAVQLPLELGHRPAQGRADFLVANCNAAAVAWIDRWPDWPGPALALVGPAGSGKSHLVHVYMTRARARLVALGALTSSSVPELLGDAQAWAIEADDDQVDERGMLHLINVVNERRGHLLLAARVAPARWAIGLPDLASRLAAIPVVAIEPPDDAVIGAVIVKLFADRQITVGTDVVSYLVSRIDRSFAAVSRVVERLDRLALAEGRPVTVPLVRRVVAEFSREGGQIPLL
jgi:chromosomal replication initiation ATPase DnaA